MSSKYIWRTNQLSVMDSIGSTSIEQLSISSWIDISSDRSGFFCTLFNQI